MEVVSSITESDIQMKVEAASTSRDPSVSHSIIIPDITCSKEHKKNEKIARGR